MFNKYITVTNLKTWLCNPLALSRFVVFWGWMHIGFRYIVYETGTFSQMALIALKLGAGQSLRVMFKLGLTFLHCLQHFFFEHLFHLYY